jgi:hypothetical protein
MNMKIISASLPLLFAGCSDTAREGAGTENWAILVPPASEASSWRLEESAVPELLSGAKAYLERTLATRAYDIERTNITGILSRWDSYSCQVLPYIEKKDGRRVATLLFFPTEDRTRRHKDWDWRKVPLEVFGGGYAYWRVSYDPEKREYFRFGVNAIQ